MSEASHLNLLFLCVCFELIISWYTITLHCFVTLKFFGSEPPQVQSHLTTEKFKSYETVKGGCIPSKNKFKTQKNNKLRWLNSDINLKLLHTGCRIARGYTLQLRFIAALFSCGG